MKIEVLCATMHQTGLEKYEEMNLQTDVVFANQAESHDYTEKLIDGNSVKMITTPYRGVGNNRNIAILHLSGDILMFADDDMVYADGYPEKVKRAFEENPEVDMMMFECNSNSELGMPTIDKFRRVRLWNFLRYGTVNFAIRKESLLKYNLSFSQLFGGGSRYIAGEDSLFLRDALRKGLKVYSYPLVIAKLEEHQSTWFRGYDERYFFDNGAWLQAAFPILKHLLVWYCAVKFSKRGSLRRIESVKIQYAGINSYYKGMSYDEWKNRFSKETD